MNEDSMEAKPGSALLAKRCERLLRAYPADYRAAHGAELVGTLLEVAEAGRTRPAPREAAGLVAGGLAARARKAAEGPVPWWAGGLHLGLALLALINLTYAVADYLPAYRGFFAWGWLGLSLLLAVSLLRGWMWVALPLAAIGSFDLVGLWHDDRVSGLANSLGVQLRSTWVPAGMYRTNQMFFWILTAGILVLASRRALRLPQRTLAWGWLAIPLIALVFAWAGLRPVGNESMWSFTMVLEAGLLSAGLAATVIAASPRWAMAAAIYMLPWEAYVLLNPEYGPVATTYWGVFAIAVLSLAGAAYKVRGKA